MKERSKVGREELMKQCKEERNEEMNARRFIYVFEIYLLVLVVVISSYT